MVVLFRLEKSLKYGKKNNGDGKYDGEVKAFI